MPPRLDDARPNPLLAVAEQWLGAWRLTAALSWASAASLVQLADPRRSRKVWSANLTEIADRTLRSPEFLRLMACNIRAMAEVARFNPVSRSR